MIVTDARVAVFISEQLGVALCPPYTVMGIERDGVVVAGVLFNGFEARNVHVTVAGTGWNRAFIKAVGRYVFGQLGCLRMTVTTQLDDVAEYAERLGGRVEGEMFDYYGDGQSAFIVGILRRNWQFAID